MKILRIRFSRLEIISRYTFRGYSTKSTSNDKKNVRTVEGAYKYAVAILEEEANLVIRVMWASKVSLRDHTMNALIDTFYDTLNGIFNAVEFVSTTPHSFTGFHGFRSFIRGKLQKVLREGDDEIQRTRPVVHAPTFPVNVLHPISPSFSPLIETSRRISLCRLIMLFHRKSATLLLTTVKR